MTPYIRLPFVAALLCAILLCGCGQVASEQQPAPTTNATEQGTHSHPEHGPHDGDLIELGDEEWHAELVHTKETVTVYILDSAATSTVAIDAASVRINLKHDDKPQQFELLADPLESDAEGTSSRFFIEKASSLVHALDHDDAEAKLAVMIRGRQYVGEIGHAHDEPHNHGPDDEPHAH